MEPRFVAPQTTRSTQTEAELENLEAADEDALRARWVSAFGAEAPSDLGAAVLRLGLAWRLQAQALGGLSRETHSRIMDLQLGLALDPAYRLTPIGDLAPGTVLTREWEGRTHTVYVLADRFAWEGRTYNSLTAVAHAITRKAWPGPAFFGLYKPRRRAVRATA